MDTKHTTIALLGATGQTGREVLKLLLKRPNLTLKIYVRFKSKLLQQSPDLDQNPNVQIYEGAVTDVANLKACLRDATTIICTLGGNDNRPGMRVISDGTATMVSALQELRQSRPSTWTKPHVLLLSSNTWNPNVRRPALMVMLVKRAFWYPYADLLKGHENLQRVPELLTLLLIQPPAIVEGPVVGHAMGVDQEAVEELVAYPDLAAGFVEAAMNEQYRQLPALMVSSKGLDFGNYGAEIAKRVVVGLCGSYLPGFWMVHDWFFP